MKNFRNRLLDIQDSISVYGPWILLWVSVFAIMFLVIFSKGYFQNSPTERFADWSRAEATVLQSAITEKLRYRRTTQVFRTVHLKLQYRKEDGDWQDATCLLIREQGSFRNDFFQRGSSIQIRYLPEKPKAVVFLWDDQNKN